MRIAKDSNKTERFRAREQGQIMMLILAIQYRSIDIAVLIFLYVVFMCRYSIFKP